MDIFVQKVTVQKESSNMDSIVKKNPAAQKRERIIRRAALEFKDGMYGILSFPPTDQNIYLYRMIFP